MESAALQVLCLLLTESLEWEAGWRLFLLLPDGSKRGKEWQQPLLPASSPKQAAPSFGKTVEGKVEGGSCQPHWIHFATHATQQSSILKASRAGKQLKESLPKPSSWSYWSLEAKRREQCHPLPAAQKEVLESKADEHSAPLLPPSLCSQSQLLATHFPDWLRKGLEALPCYSIFLADQYSPTPFLFPKLGTALRTG